MKGGDKMCKGDCWMSIFPILIIVFSFWQIAASVWIIVISAILMLILPHTCGGMTCEPKTPVKKAKKKKK